MIKSLYRNWGRTLLSFALFVSTFLLMTTQAAEYVNAVENYDASLAAYYGTGTVELIDIQYFTPSLPFYIKADGRVAGEGSHFPKQLRAEYRFQTLPAAQLEMIAAMDYVDSNDARVMTAGISQEYYRLDEGESYYNYLNRCVIEGTFTGLNEGDPAFTYSDEWKTKGVNEIVLEDCILAAGTSPWDVAGKQIKVCCSPLRYDQGGIQTIGGPGRFIVTYNDSYIYDTAYMKQLREGERYAVVVRYEPMLEETYHLAGELTTPTYEPVWNVEGAADWRTAPEFSKPAELMEIMEADRHTFDMVYTENMALIPQFAGAKLVIEEGRALSKADSDAAAHVCVISHEMAEAYGLAVGDRLTFDLGNELFEQYKGLGAQAVLPQRLSNAWTSVELEIVGVYADLESNYIEVQKPNWYYSVNTVFLPKAILRETGARLDGHYYAPPEFSFRVNAGHIRAFTEETLPKIEHMGYTVRFDDHGWLELEQSFLQAKKTMTVELYLYCVAAAVVIALGIYLHISREKKNYAIMRALGTSRKRSFRNLLAPFLLSFGASALLSALAALLSAPVTAKRLLVIAVCALLELVIALAGALAMLWRIERRPLLLLLQEGKNGK